MTTTKIPEAANFIELTHLAHCFGGWRSLQQRAGAGSWQMVEHVQRRTTSLVRWQGDQELGTGSLLFVTVMPTNDTSMMPTKVVQGKSLTNSLTSGHSLGPTSERFHSLPLLPPPGDQAFPHGPSGNI